MSLWIHESPTACGFHVLSHCMTPSISRIFASGSPLASAMVRSMVLYGSASVAVHFRDWYGFGASCAAGVGMFGSSAGWSGVDPVPIGKKSAVTNRAMARCFVKVDLLIASHREHRLRDVLDDGELEVLVHPDDVLQHVLD